MPLKGHVQWANVSLSLLFKRDLSEPSDKQLLAATANGPRNWAISCEIIPQLVKKGPNRPNWLCDQLENGSI